MSRRLWSSSVGRASAAAALSCAAAAAPAAPTGFTGKAAFDAAIATLAAAQTVDFESDAVGTTFASGTGTGGLVFVYAIDGPSTLQVSATFGTTSGTHYLGLDNPDTAFYLGDSLTIGFGRTVRAVGLYVIAGADAQAGDMQLSAGGASVANAAVADRSVSDGQAFYLGLVETDPALGFTSATLAGVPSGGAFLAFTADDITTAVSAVPEPGSAGLLLAGVLALAARARQRR